MNSKLLIALSFIAGQVMVIEAMELAKEDQLVIPRDTTNEKVAIAIQGEVSEIPKRYISFIETLETLQAEGTPLETSPITLVSLDTWKLIEEQLDRVYAITKGNIQVREQIISEYSQLDSARFIELILAVDFLGVFLLKPITSEIAQNKLTHEEVLTLPQGIRNEIIIHKAITKVGPIPIKEKKKIRNHESAVSVLAVTADAIVSGAELLAIMATRAMKYAIGICHQGAPICSVCITHDRKIVSSDDKGKIAIHDMAGEKLAVWQGHSGAVWSICALADGRIVSGSEDGTVRLWDINGRALGLLREHRWPISSVCVTPDDKVISLSEDGIVHICDPNTLESVVCKDPGNGIVGLRSLCVSDNKVISGFRDKAAL
jgi:hypothetical protein